MNVVKVETNTVSMCHGCLSTGRKTAPLGDYSRLFYILIGPQQPITVYSNEEVKLCWECEAMLRKLQAFQNQLKTAQNMLLQMLYQMSPGVVPLTKLSTMNKDYFDFEINHFDIIDSKTNVDSKNLEIPDITELPNITELPTIKEEIADATLRDDEYDSKEDYIDFNEYTKEFEYDTKDNIITKEETVPKLERDSNKKKKKEKSISLVAKYKMYARTIRSEKKNWGSCYEMHFKKVFLTEKEMEDLLSETDRRQKGYANFPYKCKECHLGYLRVIDYYRHNDLNHHKPDTPYQCRVCKKHLPTLATLAEHWREHCGLYQCNMCGDYCRPRMLKRHLNFEHTKQYGCKDCRLEFGSLKKFALHYKKSHGTYICHHCNKVCSEKRIIEKHIARRHGDYYCKKCDRQYQNYTKYRGHLRLFHPKQINITENLELAYCVECDRQYPSVYKYKIHLKESPKHTPKVPIVVPCPECGKTFSRKSYMNNHYRLLHLKVTKYYCEPCNKYYANSYGLRHHRENVHLKLPKIKDKICDICGRGFHTNGVLIKHRRTHTGERPYKCAYCTASFAQITAMKTHQRTQHKEHVETKSADKYLQSSENREKFVHPGESRDKFLHPGESRDKFLHPGESREKFLLPDESRDKFLHPGESRDKFLHPGESRDKFLHPGESRDKFLHPGESREKFLHPGESRDKFLHPGESRDKFVHPGESREKFLHPSEASAAIMHHLL